MPSSGEGARPGPLERSNLRARAVDFAQATRACAHGLLDLLPGLRRRRLEALGIAGDDLGVGLDQLEHPLRAIERGKETFPVPCDRILTKFLEGFPRTHWPERRAGRLDGGGAQLAE